MREALRQGLISEDSITEALLQARGDLFVAASILGVTGRELDSYIRASEPVQAFAAAIDTVKRDVEYEKLSASQFAEELDRLTRGYKLEALDIIHEIALLPANTAAMAEVKLKAAVELRGSQTTQVTGGNQAGILQELNLEYQQSAQRIKSVRAVQIEYHN